MQYRKIGPENLEVSAIGLGCMGMTHAYGAPADKNEMIRLMAEAVDLGVNFFDTAEVYGPYDNEILVGEGLKTYRNKVKIATKFGVHLEHVSTGAPIPDSRPEVIRASVEGSLKRLQIDCIDLYYQHRVDPDIPMEEVAGVIEDLYKEGKIRGWGLSQATSEDVIRAHAAFPLTAVESRYSMLSRDFEYSLFPVLEEFGISFVAFSPLANGFLTDQYNKETKFEDEADYRKLMPQFSGENYDANVVLLDLLRKLSKEKEATPAQISLAWMLAKKPYIIPIPGTRKLHRLKENTGAVDIILTDKEVKDIDQALDNMELGAVFGGTKKDK